MTPYTITVQLPPWSVGLYMVTTGVILILLAWGGIRDGSAAWWFMVALIGTTEALVGLSMLALVMA